MYYSRKVGFLSIVAACALFAPPAQAQWAERGTKIAAAAASARQGSSVALSADGTTLIEGGPGDEAGRGAAWVFNRSGGGWAQQGQKLTADHASGERVLFGCSAALSADGSTAFIGDAAGKDGVGGAWVFRRADGAWKPEAKLAGDGASAKPGQCQAVGLSADGNAAIIGGVTEDASADAAWVFTRSGSGWTQPGDKLVGGGRAVALSGDGNTALTAGPAGVWIFTRSGDTWTRQAKLAGSGSAAALSSDGSTAVIARSAGDGNAGAAWVFTRSGDLWTQEGDKLSAPPGNAAGIQFGFSVALSADGNRLLAGAPGSEGGAGAAWEFRRVNGAWMQVGKLTGSGASGKAQQGYAVALSADGHDAIVGGVLDGAAAGAVWTFADPTLSIAVPAAAAAGVPVTIAVMAHDDRGNPVVRYPGPLHFSSSDAEADLPRDAPLTNGSGVFSVTFKTHGPQTITAADTAVSTIAATSDPVPVSAGPAARFLVQTVDPPAAGPRILLAIQPVDSFGNPAEYDGAVRVTSTDPFASLPAGARLRSGGRLAVTLRTPGEQTVTVTSSVNPRVSGSVLIPLGGSSTLSTDYISAVLATNPIAYFRLEATSDTSKVGTYTSTFMGAGATLATPGAPICEPNNHSAALDSLSGFVTTTLSGGITTAGSIGAWVNTFTLPSVLGHFLYVAGESQGGNDFDIQFTTDNFIRFYVSDNSINVGYQPNAETLVGAWHMVVGTFDSTTNTENLYWDGQLVATAHNIAFANKNAPFNIGESEVFPGRFFGGQIDEVAVWNTALTAAQVQSIYNSATCSPLIVNDPETIQVTDSGNPIGSLLLPDSETIQVTDSVNPAISLLTATANVNPPNAGTVTGGGMYASGTTATFTATANLGFVFANFSGSVPTTSANPLQVTVIGPLTIVANFTPIEPALTVAILGPHTDSPETVELPVTITNAGGGSASNAQIVSVTATVLTGNGSVSTMSGVPSSSATLARGGFVTVPVVLNWPTTATRVSLKFSLNATDVAGNSRPATQTVTIFR